MKTYIKAFFLISLFFLGSWGMGFFWFAQSVPDYLKDMDTDVDAIVVLTGGSKRLETALELLVAGKGSRLLISGVGANVDQKALEQQIRTWPRDLQAAIDLGHVARDTRENSLETKDWVEQHGFSSIRLVTSSYHLKRSMAEFRAIMPDLKIVPHPVFKDEVHSPAWWQAAIREDLIIGEYHKYLLAKLRIYLNSLLRAMPYPFA